MEQSYTSNDWLRAKAKGINYTAFRQRISRGLTPEQAINMPKGMHLKTYLKMLANGEIEVRRPPWPKYQFYQMFKGW